MVQKSMENIIDWYNPNENELDNIGDYVVYGFKWLILILAIFTVLTAIKNRKNIREFLRNTLEELKKVEWLDSKTLREYSTITVVLITLMSLVILGFDTIFTSIRDIII